ncbi:hypothetical protein ASE36_06050 [Rhizobium sp. Root274]|uniref:phage major capsid protein n=1 Tax=unclassified Rhizobium TaxID=2613769 RepID=UPI000713B19D|nr:MULTISPECIES: phage major capsid protein [unclassified Rhizobium]KQW31783.1 hypothetical protein ASC71_06055 [Rhizobium sp. Root1240]KRD33323.1 hypothetical protein ASE36_06050 [Rhizobium sp. Root274]
MTLKLKDLIEKRNTALKTMTDAHEANNSEAFNTAETELRSIDAQIDRAKKIDAFERVEVGRPLSGDTKFSDEVRHYDLGKAILGAMNGRLEGREAEIDQEMKRGRESRSGAGIHLAVPSEIFLGSAEQRAGQMVASDPSGGYTVKTDLGPLADRFRPALKVEAMGATVLRGLVGDLDLPNLLSSGSANWIGENQDVTRSAATFGRVSMSPKTVAGEYRMSRRLLIQSSVAIESILRRDLGFLLAQKLDAAAIDGNGVTAPIGILNTANVSKVTTETAFSDTTANLISELELDDVTGTAAFLTNPTVMKMVRKLKDGDGHIMPVSELFHNTRAEVTTQVPTNIGTGGNKSALVYGQWGELYIGYWSAVDLLLNPYHPDVASNGGALLHAFLDADTGIRHSEAFSYAEI